MIRFATLVLGVDPKRPREYTALEHVVELPRRNILLGRVGIEHEGRDLTETWYPFELGCFWMLANELEQPEAPGMVTLRGENSGRVRFPLRKGAVEVEVSGGGVRHVANVPCKLLLETLVAEQTKYYRFLGQHTGYFTRDTLEFRTRDLNEVFERIARPLWGPSVRLRPTD